MSNNIDSLIDTVVSELLVPNQLSLSILESAMDSFGARSIDFGEVFIQSINYESFSLEDGRVKAGSFSHNSGFGVRAVSGEKTGFSYCDGIDAHSLIDSAKTASSIAKRGSGIKRENYSKTRSLSKYAPVDPLTSMSDKQKANILLEIDQDARRADPRVEEVSASLTSSFERMLVMSTDGVLAADIRPLVRLSVSVIASEGNKRERGNAGGGGRYSLDRFVSSESPSRFAREAVRMAGVNLRAKPAPAGRMQVVLGPGWPGVLLHEAVGHGLEGDFNRKGSSTFSGRVGEKVASPLCTVVDDGTLVDCRGSLSIDDEGAPTRRNILIENGVLKNYMQDKLNSRLMNVPTTGNGRRESYACLPMPRMTNTFLEAGKSDPAEILNSMDSGVYAVNFGGGSVDITSGGFVFSATEAYFVERGEIKYPIKGATLIGSGPEVMRKISMVGNDLQLDSGVGVCGKQGQSVPVGVGQPTLKIDEIVVGGTQTES
jgi:TldD protein